MIADANKLLDERYMIWPPGSANQLQTGMLRRLMPLFIIAFQAGANQIFPGIFTAVDFGYDMINRHLRLLLAAILASRAVALDNILAGKHDPFYRHFYIEVKPDYRWNRYLGRLRPQHISVGSLYNFGLAHIKHYDGTPYAAHRNRFEILVQYQHLTV